MLSSALRSAGLSLAIFFFSAPSYAWIAEGFSEEDPKIKEDMEVLVEFKGKLSLFLPQSELSNIGFKLARRIEDRFPIVVHEDKEIRVCSMSGKARELKACSSPFDEWSKADPILNRTPVKGVWIYSPYLDALAKHGKRTMIGLDENRLLTVDKPTQVILVLDKEFLKSSSNFDTDIAVHHFRVGSYLGAARVFDMLALQKEPLSECNLGFGRCDGFRDGPHTQAAAYMLTASVECSECTSKDKAILFNAGVRLLTGAPTDAKIDLIEILENYNSIITKTTIPESLEKELKDRRILHIGISPSID